MRSIQFTWSNLRPVRFLLACCICALLVFSHALPAYSDTINPTGTPSSLTEGEANLLDIEKEAQKAATSKPYSQEKTKEKATQGLNEIQGTADIDKMKRPENSQGAESVEDKIKKALEKIAP